MWGKYGLKRVEGRHVTIKTGFLGLVWGKMGEARTEGEGIRGVLEWLNRLGLIGFQ